MGFYNGAFMTQDELNLPDANDDTLLAVNAWLSRHNIKSPTMTTSNRQGD